MVLEAPLASLKTDLRRFPTDNTLFAKKEDGIKALIVGVVNITVTRDCPDETAALKLYTGTVYEIKKKKLAVVEILSGYWGCGI